MKSTTIALFAAILHLGCESPPRRATSWQSNTVHWTRHTVDASSQGADGVKIADVNHDGWADITTGWEEGGVVRVYLHPGKDAVREEWPAVTVGEVESVEDAVFFDADADGIYDVVSSAEGDTRAMYFHRAPGSIEDYLTPLMWSKSPIESSRGRMQWMFAISFDVDGDGRQDLVAAGKNEGAEIGWFRNDAEADSNWAWRTLAPVSWVMSIVSYDVNEDGNPDIVYTDRKGDRRGVYTLISRKTGEDSYFEQAQYLGGNEYELMFMSMGNITGDEKKEILAATRDNGVLVLNESSAKKWNPSMIPYPENAGTGKGIAIGDLDGDGVNEIVLSSENAAGEHGVYALKRVGKAWQAIDIGGLAGAKFDRIELVDMDGDGDLDVLTCEESENLGVIWYENPHAL